MEETISNGNGEYRIISEVTVGIKEGEVCYGDIVAFIKQIR